MTSISDLRIDMLLKPILMALAARDHACSAEYINSRVINILQEHAVLISDPRAAAHLAQKLALARTSLTIAGLIEAETQGHWRLTEAGRQAQSLTPDSLLAILKQSARTAPTPAISELEAINREHQHASWQSRLIEVILAMKPDAFERLCQRILRASHFIRVEVTGRSGDDGIDGIGILRVNLLSFHVMFQCKRWRNPVGAPQIRDFRGALTGRAEKGLIFTTSSFTAAAYTEAARPGVLPIDLVDGDALCELLKSLKLGVYTKIVEEIEIDPDFFRLM